MAKEAFSIKLETDKFNKHIRQLTRRYPDKVDLVLKRYALGLLDKIVRKNPVDTGRSRAAWYPSMRGLSGHFDFGSETGPEGNSPSSSSQVGLGKNEGSYKQNFTGSKHYIELINGAWYIVGLEYGRSSQAPYGMLRISMREITEDTLPQELGKELQKEWKKFRV